MSELRARARSDGRPLRYALTVLPPCCTCTARTHILAGRHSGESGSCLRADEGRATLQMIAWTRRTIALPCLVVRA